MSTQEPASFRPPSSFVAASEARQAKLKAKKENRQAQSNTSTPTASTKTVKAQPKAKTPSKSNPRQEAKKRPVIKKSADPTVQNIAELSAKREARRQELAQVRSQYAGLTVEEKETLIHKRSIAAFRKKQSKALGEKPLDMSSSLIVCVRKRPMSRQEKEGGQFDAITTHGNKVFLHTPSRDVTMAPTLQTSQFSFDRVFDEQASTEQVYTAVIEPMMKRIIEKGTHGLIFAYGQTGSGKTHTLLGSDSTKGLLHHALPRLVDGKHEVQVQFFELYGAKVLDLLNPNTPSLRMLQDSDGSLHIPHLTTLTSTDSSELTTQIEQAFTRRHTGESHANATSSRSHALLRLTRPDGPSLVVLDLAGSERGADTNSTRSHTASTEANDINTSLLALKECIRALGRGERHVPFRASKLTMLLKPALVGDAVAVAIGTLAPGSKSVEASADGVRTVARLRSRVRKEEEEEEEVEEVESEASLGSPPPVSLDTRDEGESGDEEPGFVAVYPPSSSSAASEDLLPELAQGMVSDHLQLLAGWSRMQQEATGLLQASALDPSTYTKEMLRLVDSHVASLTAFRDQLLNKSPRN